MAKNEASKEVAQIPAAQTLPATVTDQSMFFEDAGVGLTNVNREDIAIPFLKVLQALSDQMDKTNSAYIKGAEQGMIFNTVSGSLTDGESGIVVVPVAWLKSHIEWKPRSAGGGIVQNYGEDPAILQKCTTGDKGKLLLPNGNEVVVSANYYVYVVDEATGNYERALIAMSRTQMKHSKKWMAQITGIQLPRPDGKGSFTPPIFYQSYRLTTAAESNNDGTWYTWRTAPFKKTVELPNGVNLYKDAREFSRAIQAGEIKAPDPMQGEDLGGSDFAAGVAQDDGDEVPY